MNSRVFGTCCWMRTLARWATLVGSISVAACGGDGLDESAETMSHAQTGACAGVSGTLIDQSLVVRNPEVLAKFSFNRVMSRIRNTANIATTETNAILFQRWMRTFGSSAASGDCNDPRIDPNDYGLRCPRTAEAKLATKNPFATAADVTFVPVGLFNRFDLTPANGSHCGEYRIVYAMSSTASDLGGRGFLIFEGILPNPTPAAGIDACLPVAQFWQELSADADVTSRAAKLERFYITGGAITGFSPVVRAQHYGFANGTTAAHGAGQVRTNFFVDFGEWHLREFRLRRTCTDPADVSTCKLAFEHVTVKTNPAEELFAGTHASSSTFRTAFVPQVDNLAATNVNLIRMSISNQFNEFESISQASNVVYSSRANATIRSQIQTKLNELGSTLTVNQILDRATTQTCAGCHQVSNGISLGGGLSWPSSLGFVQIDENRNLSPALTTKFLPRRKAVLEAFINARCGTGGTASVPAGETVGGSIEGAAN